MFWLAGRAHESQELGSGLIAIAEDPEHGAGDGLGVLFFDAAHHHAEVPGLNDHADAAGEQHVPGFGGDVTADKVGKAVGIATAVGIAAHAIGTAASKKGGK